jgi:hypothetical protein
VNVLGALLFAGFTGTMVALAWPAWRPSRASVWTGIAGLALLPGLFVVVALWAWALGQ